MTGARRRGAPLAPVALLLAMIMVGLFPSLAWAKPKVAFTISDDRVTESSGLATDEPNNRYWTVNDSGDRGAAYAISADGKVLGSVGIATPVTDLEAVAMRNNVIYLADIGDNDKKRDYVTVYVITDPDPGDDRRSYNAYDFSYPDGPQDAEAFFLDADGRMCFITKAAKGEIYRASAQPARDRINELVKVGDAPALVTDATMLPGNKELVVRSYLSVEVLDPKTFKTVAQVEAPTQPQGESITWSLFGDNLLLGSEGKDSKVYEIPVPSEQDSSASPTTSPSAGSSGTATPSADSSGDDDDDTGPAPDSGGTYLALGLAAAVAVVAAAVVIVIRK